MLLRRIRSWCLRTPDNGSYPQSGLMVCDLFCDNTPIPVVMFIIQYIGKSAKQDRDPANLPTVRSAQIGRAHV